MRAVQALGLVVFAFHLVSTADARAQAARRGSYYDRTTTTGGYAGMAVGRGVGSLERTSASNFDPLRLYSSRASTAYTSAPPAVRPVERPIARPTPRNYYPTARSGQTRHCTPSRAGTLGR